MVIKWWDWVSEEQSWQILITNIYISARLYLGGKVLNLTDARSSSAHQCRWTECFTILVVLTFSIDLSGVNNIKTRF